MRRWLVGAVSCVFLGFALQPVAAQTRLRTVASFSILADMVANVGGEQIDLAVLVGPDTDSHTYQPSPADARQLANAQVLVLNGLGFEGWIERLARSAPFRGRRIVASEGIRPITVPGGGHHHHGHGHSHGSAGRDNPSTRAPLAGSSSVNDPHCWQDLECGRRYVANIAAGLAAADPANAADYRRRADAYSQRLADLDRWVRAEIERVPAAKRKAIVGHDAFGYFARAYQVTFRAPVGFSTEQQPSAKEVAALIAQVRQEGIKAVFVENMTNPAQVQQVARDAGVVVGPRLYVDALSRSDGPAPTYERLFRHNVTTLVEGMLRN